MKFLSSNQKTHDLPQMDCESDSFTVSEQNNPNKKIQNLNFSSQNPCKIHQIQILNSDSQFNYQKSKIQQLVERISSLPKTQINFASKLFVQLGFQLSLYPEKISEINPSKDFLRYVSEFAKKLKDNKENFDENQSKIYKICLNSLLYVLMLLLNGENENCKKQEFKQKLFGNKAFLKQFLGIQIYKHCKISKLYGLIIVHIYKQNPSLDVKKCLVQSIIKNLKHIDHEKTQLNLSMILNQLKFSYVLKQGLVRQQNLMNKIREILHKNQQTFQSVHTLSYFLYLVKEFPDLSKKNYFEIERKIEITENIKKFVFTSSFYQKTYIKFFQWCIKRLDQKQALILSQQLLTKMEQRNEQKEGGNNNFIGRQKWINFLLELMKIFIRSTAHQQSAFFIIENGLFGILIEMLKNESFENATKNKIYQVLLNSLNRIKTSSLHMYHTLLSFISNQLIQQQNSEDVNNRHRQRILKQMEQQQTQYFSTMELQ